MSYRCRRPGRRWSLHLLIVVLHLNIVMIIIMMIVVIVVSVVIIAAGALRVNGLIHLSTVFWLIYATAAFVRTECLRVQIIAEESEEAANTLAATLLL